MIAPAAPSGIVAHNIRRLLTRLAWRYDDLVQASGVDERTLRRILRGTSEPRPATLQRIAEALGATTDELFIEQPALFAARFDEVTNPQVAAAVRSDPARFAGWTQLDFDELHSRFGVGGELTIAGALATADSMNGRRETLRQASHVLETSQGELLAEFVALLYRRCAEQGVMSREQGESCQLSVVSHQ